MTDDYDLEEALLGPEPDYDAEPEAPPDAERASRMLRRLAHIRERREEDRDVARAEESAILAWLSKREEAHAREEEWVEEALRRYHRAVLARDAKRLTVRLPSGDLTSRAQQPEWEWDEEAFLAWAREHMPEAVRRPPPPADEIDKGAAKSLLTRRDDKGEPIGWGRTEAGEAPPGVTVRERGREFTPRPHPLRAEEAPSGEEG